MQYPQDPQPVYPDPSMAPPGAGAPNPYYTAPPTPAAAPRRSSTIGRGSRLILHRSLRVLVQLGRFARPYALFLVIIAVMAAIMGWMGLRLMAATSAPVVGSTSQNGPAPAVESFIKGHQSFNADEMWSAYSADYQIEQIQQGFTKKSLEHVMSTEQTQGLHLGQYKYVGSTPTDAGTMHFYTIDVQVQNQTFQLPMIFNVDKDGQITHLEGAILNNITPHTQSGN